MTPKPPPSALEKAMRILSIRACSEAELSVRLRRAGYTPEETKTAVRECARRHYVDDELLAGDCTMLWQSRGHGLRSIRSKLRQRGVPTEVAEAALAEAAENEENTAIGAIEAKLPSLMREKDNRKRQAKALRFLSARGFSGDALRAAMARLKAAAKPADEDADFDGLDHS